MRLLGGLSMHSGLESTRNERQRRQAAAMSIPIEYPFVGPLPIYLADGARMSQNIASVPHLSTLLY
jgi:hypothetical protein